ncbi:MAG TPA: hypothetical protein VGG10_14540 [Rhizomicrobium sp.]|jgi:hypothetical protein
MSNVGFAPERHTLTNPSRCLIGSQAEYRASDYFFPRTQSLSMRAVPWERKPKPIQPVDRYALYALALVASLTLAYVLI